ncbi:MAG: HutD family protein [Marinifilaceae bacterium]|jgi:hypothetical protein|nr:HutD family protein [Marinifilaceae bacterium]
MKIIRKENQNTGNWSGGTTTELYIFPENSIYQERNFEYRISSAIVAIDESEFTSLNAYARKIMTLEGSMHLYHENHYDIQLDKFDTDSFHGSWKTKSIGKVTDFNLMTSKNYDGDIKGIIVKNDIDINIKDLLSKNTIETLSLYIYKGECYLNNISLKEKDYIILSKNDLDTINTLKCIEKAEIIVTNVWKL